MNSSIKVGVRRLLAPVARMVVGTPLEGPAYSVWNVVTRGSRPTGAVEYDELTMSVMQRVLSHDSNGIDVGAHRGTILRSWWISLPMGVTTRWSRFRSSPTACVVGFRVSRCWSSHYRTSRVKRRSTTL